MADVIVVGTDGSATAQRAVVEAMRLAKALGGSVHVVSAHDPSRGLAAAGASGYVVAPLDDEEAVGAALAAATAAVGAEDVEVQTHAVRGTPAEALIAVADAVSATMIVVGNQGMHGVKRVLGSVPNAVSHRANCNVLIVSTDAE